jgi:TrwC relaxase
MISYHSVKSISHFHHVDDLGTGGAAVTLRVNAGHDIEYPLRSAGSAVGYYLQDGKEPPGQWAGTAAGALGLAGQVDPEVYRNLFGKLAAPAGEKLYTGRPPRYVTGPGQSDSDEDVAAAVAALGPFATPAEVRRTRAKVLGAAPRVRSRRLGGQAYARADRSGAACR